MTSMIQRESAAPDWAALDARMYGNIVTPTDSTWDEARRAWNLAVDQRPVAVALPETAGDVIDVVAFAREHGLRVAPQGTGHGASAAGLADAVLVKTSRMRGVSVDPSTRTVRAEAGAWWQDAVEAAAPHGLTVLHGSSPDVGVVGYTLGGGMGWLARSKGFAASSVTAIEIVLSDGRFVRADRDNEPDLFWALRGGGGNFGVVTAIEFRAYELTHVYAGIMFFPVERASEVLNAWREWTQDVPDEVTSVGRIMQFPPLPMVPEPLRGKSFALVEAVYVGEEADGAALTAPLRALGPVMDTFAQVPTTQLPHLHMDPPQPVPGHGDGALLRELTAETVDALVDVAGPGSGSPLVSVEVRHLGGALARPSAEHGALAAFDAEYAVFAVGVAPDAETKALTAHHVERTLRALEPWQAEQTYLNFAESPRGGRHWSEAAYRRLRRVKAQYDPQNAVRANHPVPSA